MRSTWRSLCLGVSGAMICLSPALAQPVLPQDNPRPAVPVAPAAPGTAPVFEIDRLRHGFGKVFDTEPVKTQFTFKNTGDAVLVVQDVHSTCGCTAADLAKLQYEPGESGTLEVAFKPAGKRGASHQRVTIRTNDPVNPVTVLTISADVSQVVYAEPPIANVGQVHKGATQDQLVSVYGRTADFAVTEVTVIGSEFFTAEIIGTEEEEIDGEMLRRTDLVVSLSPGAPPGHISAVAAARTNDPREDMVNIQLVARIQGDVEVSPSRIAFGRVAPGVETEFPVIVRHARGESFRILGLEEQSTADIETDYRVEPLDPEKQDAYRVTFTFHGGEKPGAIRGRLLLQTDVPQEETVDLTYLGRIVPADQTDAAVSITDGRNQ